MNNKHISTPTASLPVLPLPELRASKKRTLSEVCGLTTSSIRARTAAGQCDESLYCFFLYLTFICFGADIGFVGLFGLASDKFVFLFFLI